MRSIFKKAITLILVAPCMASAASNLSNEDCAIKRHYLSDLSGISRMLCSKAIDAYKAGRQTARNVDTICSSTQNVAWYQDRDNSMSDANDEVGKAMAVVLGPTGTVTQAVQVCPGVYLATAHGALDSPVVARKNKRGLMAPGTLTKIIAYPMARENMMRQRDSSQYISPRLRDPSLWEAGNEESDYVFVKIDSPVRPKSFVTPLNVTPDQIAQNQANLEINMYRGKSRYAGAETGAPDHREENAVPSSDTRALSELYQKPQRVNTACSVSGVDSYNSSYVDHNCPSEQSNSGANFSTNLNGKNYLVGINTMGASVNIDSSKDAGGSTMLTSSSFCADYQTACGQPCPKFEDVMPESGQSI